MHAFILAGGFATRLWPLTEQRAKPLLPLAGKPLIDHPIEQIPEDIPITVSTNAVFGERFAQWKNGAIRKGINVIVERTESDDQKLGALGAVSQWITEAKIDDDILLLTGDNYFGFHMGTFLDAYQKGTPLLAAYDIGSTEKARAFGTVVTNGTERIVKFEEKPANPQTTLVSTGCSILPRNVLPILQEHAKQHPDNVGGIFEELLQRSIDINCFTFSEPWFDIGSFEAYLEATQAIIGEQTVIDEGGSCRNTQCCGSVVIGRNTHVHDSTLENVVLFNDCIVEDCELRDCIIDSGSHVRGIDLTGKMLREGTKLIR